MSNTKCRWLGCSRPSTVRIPKESPAIGEYDLPLCHKHAKRATGEKYRVDRIGTNEQ